MTNIPTITTPRLVLRPFTLKDAPRVQHLAGDTRIADVTSEIPHPYPIELAKTWINSHPSTLHNQNELLALAIEQLADNSLIGCISIKAMNTDEPELGYWLGVSYWNQGYATESCKALLHFAFETLGLTAIVARCLQRNPISKKVLLKVGFKHIGEEVGACGYQNNNERIDRFKIEKVTA